MLILSACCDAFCGLTRTAAKSSSIGGGNLQFDEVWTVNEPWAIRRLTGGVPAGEARGFVGYWDQLTPHPGVTLPAGFSVQSHGIPPYPLEQVRFLDDHERIDLGNRKFEVLRTYSHSPDGVALYDRANEVLFGGDAFYGPSYLVTDTTLLARDQATSQHLAVRWQYTSHGAQLIQAMQHGRHLVAVERIIAGEGRRPRRAGAFLRQGARLERQPVLSAPGKALVVGWDSYAPALFLLASDEQMSAPAHDHVAVGVDSVGDLEQIHARAEAFAATDPRAQVTGRSVDD
jgi:glyoxylase-like metal-dependent hydrolase (beta-lactamase superfamily II)